MRSEYNDDIEYYIMIWDACLIGVLGMSHCEYSEAMHRLMKLTINASELLHETPFEYIIDYLNDVALGSRADKFLLHKELCNSIPLIRNYADAVREIKKAIHNAQGEIMRKGQ